MSRQNNQVNVPMNIFCAIVITGIVMFVTGVVASGASAAPDEAYYLGDTITLSGYSPESPVVYLFLTGPNLPSNGIALDDITARADQGGLTRVRVDDHDRWVYRWDTHEAGSRLDPGTYTVWITSEPVDLSSMGGAGYRTISLTLRRPGISISPPVLPGAILLRSVPDGSSVLLNGEYHGITPQTIENLEPGMYNVTFSHFGYVKQTLPVQVESGRTAEVDIILDPEKGSIAVNSNPPGAGLMLDGAKAGVAPMTLSDVAAGNHTITTSKEGYTTAEQPVRVIAGQTVRAEIVLAPQAPPTATQRAGSLVPLEISAIVVLFLVAGYYRSGFGQ
jgi:hypothetical protein